MRTLVSALAAALLMTFLAFASPSVSASSASSAEQCRRTRPAYPEIKPGTTSGAVRSLQCVLNDTRLGPVTVDGFYGPETQGAIKELTDGFECCIKNPLRVRTWYWVILFTASHKLGGLERGDSGIRVTTLQRALRANGQTLVVDGDFGAQTETQVEVFQDRCGEKETGRVNQQMLFNLSMGGCGG